MLNSCFKKCAWQYDCHPRTADTQDIGLFVWLVGFLTSSSTTRLYRGRAPRQERLTILRAATHETELGDHDFCLSRSRDLQVGLILSDVIYTFFAMIIILWPPDGPDNPHWDNYEVYQVHDGQLVSFVRLKN